jgi:hypothetical protein
MEQPVRHPSDDDLVLHYYGEDGPEMAIVERHLQSCPPCAKAYESLAQTLRAVTPPELVDPPDDTLALRELLRAHVHAPFSPAATSLPWWHGQPAAIAFAWLVATLYPLSLSALFTSARWAQEQVAGIALAFVAVLWSCAGPLVALLVLHRLSDDGFHRVSTRLRVLGALMAAISPPLFVLVASGQPFLPWYETIAAAVVLGLLPWPNLPRPSVRLRSAHRLSAILLGVFIIGHIVNQSLAFVSVASYAAMRGAMRVATQQSISYTVIVTMVAMQMTTGVAMGLKGVRGGAIARNVQAVSGWYLAAFLLAHVFGGFLRSGPAGVTPVAVSLVPPYLLADATAVVQLPYYVLGVAAFLVHVGIYARLAALTWLAESSVRRLSYAAAFVGAMVVTTVGLSLCGIHLLR